VADNTETTFENKCSILSEVWLDYRKDEEFKDFVDYNDLGLPLGFLCAEGLVQPAELAKQMVIESFELLLASMGVEDSGFETLDELMLG
jgi:hypothetical protein